MPSPRPELESSQFPNGSITNVIRRWPDVFRARMDLLAINTANVLDDRVRPRFYARLAVLTIFHILRNLTLCKKSVFDE